MANNDQLNTLVVPLSTPFGGTGIASATAYGTLIGGSSTTAASQVVSPGTAGQVLRSNGPGVAPTYQPPDLILVGSASISSSTASVAFTGLSTDYFAYKFMLQYVLPVTDGASLLMRVSTVNGSTFISSAGAYDYRVTLYGSSLSDYSSTSATFMATSLNSGNASLTGGISGEILVINPAYSAIYTCYTGQLVALNSASVVENIISCGKRLNPVANNALQFLFSSGNIASAEIRVYGVKYT